MSEIKIKIELKVIKLKYNMNFHYCMNHICGVIVSVLASNPLDRGFES